MKLPILTFISLLLLTIGFTYGQTLETYENTLLGVKFQYPSEWKIEYEQADGIKFNFTKYESSIYNSVVVGIQDSKGVKDLKQYLRKQFLEQDTQLNFPSLKLTETSLSGLPAMNASFTFDDGRNAQMIYTMKNETVYIVIYSAEPNTYSNHLAEVNDIIKSFQITG